MDGEVMQHAFHVLIDAGVVGEGLGVVGRDALGDVAAAVVDFGAYEGQLR